MNILVTIQAVDLDDPLMGFFHEWLELAAPQFTRITVIALRVGRYQLPANVTVIPMRPRTSRSKIEAAFTLWRESWKRRHQYDAVFIRSDAQYVLLAGWLWKLLGKRMVFWYAHFCVSNLAVIASFIADKTVTSVKEAFDHPWVKPIEIGQGIYAKRFSTIPRIPSPDGKIRMLCFGRVMPSKQVEDVISSFIESGAEAHSTLTITGPRSDVDYAQKISALMEGHSSIRFGEERIPYDQVPEYLASFDILLNAYPASLDKAIIESMMVGIVPIVATRGILHHLPNRLHWILARDQETRVSAIKHVLSIAPGQLELLQNDFRAFAISTHSLQNQIQRVQSLLS